MTPRLGGEQRSPPRSGQAASQASGAFGWWHEADPAARRALAAGTFGWMLDAFDVMLFALVLPNLSADLGLTKAQGGVLGSAMLIAAAGGGVAFGRLADRFGRTRALMLSVVLYSVFTFACGFANSLVQFAVLRVFLGLGMGGVWSSGAALVSESWPAAHRGKALGLMQSGWAIGYAAAVLVSGFVQPRYGWRAVFFAGILPAFFTLWVQRRVTEPAIWIASGRSRTTGAGFAELFKSGIGKLTVVLTLMNTCTLFGWWGFNLWLPSYLKSSAAQGGAGLGSAATTGYLFVMQAGMWVGYVTYGFISDRIGRRKSYVSYLLSAAALLTVYVSIRNPTALLILGPCVAFAATGYFSGFGAVTAEVYPTSVRATAQGFTYNIGRLASAAAPYLVGSLADTHGFGAALLVCSAAFVLAAVFWIWIPETRGRALT
ncbi:MAG TPA: MFS transporter [Vicinamibacterales bacterium]|nr:MFS transporter [Vicinamibacterales bacterium]